MSASGLIIEHLDNRFHSRTPLDADKCANWLELLAEADGDALSAELAGPDEWLLIRHLPLALHWREDASDADVRACWGEALRRALAQAAARPDGGEVLRYTSRREAIADLLYRCALGETSRLWAWQRMALAPRGQPTPAALLQHVVALLRAEPENIWPVLYRLIAAESDAAALTALLHALPSDGWNTLLFGSPRTAGYAELLLRSPGPGATAPDGADSAYPLPAGCEAAHRLFDWAASRQVFAARRPEVLSILIAALTWQASGSPPALLQARLQAVRARLAAALSLPLVPPRAPLFSAGETTGTYRIPERSAELPALPELPALSALPETAEWLTTRWAGALFWLGRLPATGILEWLAAQQPGYPLALLLRAIASALGVPPDDAAMRAFCGGETPSDEPPEILQQRAGAVVAAWSDWLDEAAPELVEPRLATVCQRAGRLRFESGWIELHLAMDSVDTSIRRLGLDLDPGWLAWHGNVVRISYDE